MDKAIEYTQKLNTFVQALNDGRAHPDFGTWMIETGRKFDKVY